VADDPYNLKRFVDAQAPVYETVVAELKSGRKQTHWMWFVFPQLSGLGHSPMARQYAIASAEEAKAYLDHDVLAPRLRECTQLVLEIKGRTLREIFGSPDDLKFRSSMKLFSEAAEDKRLFTAALDKYGLASTA
jgi:uncharacterized protein (DUF1810 family)